ncbi:MAG: 50S ribosomal protein L29 [bacterium]|nr:50S ribosomal protein L29 [bacterium]
MKKKEIKELKTKSQLELTKMLGEYRSKLTKLRLEVGTEKIKNIRLVARTRDDIARLMTIIKEKGEK